MGVFEMVVAVVLITTVGKVAAGLARRRPAEGDTGRVAALEAQLRANELRLSQTEDRLAELGEKVVFVETLLVPPAKAAELPSPRG